MSQSISYSATQLPFGKKGIVKPDSEGYYRLPFGELGVPNDVGEMYTLAGAQAILDTSTTFNKHIRSKNLFSEDGHPTQQPGESYEKFVNRFFTISEPGQCGHIREVLLTESSKGTIEIDGLIKPAGNKAHVLQESLDNRHENVCFSVRGVTNDSVTPTGGTERTLTKIITFDRVTMPGIERANKFNAFALESHKSTIILDQHVITPEVIEMLEDTKDTSPLCVEAAEVFEEVKSILDVRKKTPKAWAMW